MNIALYGVFILYIGEVNGYSKPLIIFD